MRQGAWLAMIAVWVLLGGGGGCSATLSTTPTHPPTPSCLDAATTVETADSSRSYRYPTDGYAVDARGVEWLDLEEDAVETSGSGTPACWVGGRIDGPYGDESVYECDSQHCPSGGCPDPCLEYHTTAGFAPETDGAEAIVEGLYLRDYGDGIGRQVDFRGHLVVKGSYLEDIKDDAIEDDWSDSDTSILDTVIDGAHIAFGERLRGSAGTPSGDAVWVVRDSLVRLRENVNPYKQRDGHGGIWKGNHDDEAHRFRLTHNVFVGDDFEGGHVFPIVHLTDECSGNTLYVADPDWADVLDENDDYPDGLTEGERLAALNTQFPGCFEVIVKPVGQSLDDFLAVVWDPLVANWRASHPEVAR